MRFRGLKRRFYVKVTVVCFVFYVRCNVLKELVAVTYSIESSIEFLIDKKFLRTTLKICRECGGSMTEARGNGSSNKLLPWYLEEYL